MTDFKIEKGIQLTPSQTNQKYPFFEMEVGDSFIISDVYTSEEMNRCGNASRSWAKQRGNGRKFALRKTDKNEIRIWRTA